MKHASTLYSGKFELCLNEAVVNTAFHGSFSMKDFSSSEAKEEAQTEQAAFSLEKTQAGKITMYRAKLRLCNLEDGLGRLITLPAQNSLQMEMTLTAKEPEEEATDSFLAVSQHKPWWMRPYFTEDLEDIPPRTQLIIGRRSGQDLFLVLMALCSDKTRADLEGAKEGIRISVSSNQNNGVGLDEPAFACAEGADPYELITEIYKELRRQRSYGFKLREEKTFPDIFRSLGWCTWDSLGHDVTEEAIFRKMNELREKQVPVKWVLIDDGWSLVDPQKQTLKGFRADSVKFPDGLSHTVRVLKEEYGVEAVGVWQAMKGYWHGIDEEFEDWPQVSDYLQRYGNGEISAKPDPAASFGFWDCWHSILEKEGIDFVKIDGQSSMSMIQNGIVSYGEGARALYKGMEASVFLHFGGRVMNCMGIAPENVINRSVTAFSRTSDDYLPTIQGSFYEHALQNAYDNVYQGSLYYGDWDMFWTEHEDASRSTLLRMISGGPVYISDGYGRTDADMIRKITDENGNLCMCDDIARPTLDCLTRDPFAVGEDGKGGILKIYNRIGGRTVIACFCGETDACSLIRPSDIPGIGLKECTITNTRTGESAACSREHPYELRMNAREDLVLELAAEK